MGRNNRLSDAEDALDACSSALALIPIWALKKGQTWVPSPEAIVLLEDAKEALNKYSRRHPS